MNTLADRVNRRMAELGFTQESLAQKIGLSQTAVFKITSGQTANPRKILELARALKVDPDWLSKGIDLNNIDDEAYRREFAALVSEPDQHSTVAQPSQELPNKAIGRPPVMEEHEWKMLSPKARALVEDFLIQSRNGNLNEAQIKLLQHMVDELSSKKDD